MYCTTMVLIKIMVQSTSTKYTLGTGYQVYENKLILVTKMYTMYQLYQWYKKE